MTELITSEPLAPMPDGRIDAIPVNARRVVDAAQWVTMQMGSANPHLQAVSLVKGVADIFKVPRSVTVDEVCGPHVLGQFAEVVTVICMMAGRDVHSPNDVPVSTWKIVRAWNGDRFTKAGTEKVYPHVLYIVDMLNLLPSFVALQNE